MRAVVISRPGGPEVLEVREVATPEPGKGEVRVRVHATAVNRADVLQRMGHYPAPPDAPKDIPGLEIAGVVDRLGDSACEWAIGDPVYGIVGGGGYAEHVVVHGRTLARIPEGLSMVEAAALPEATLTAWDALVTQGGLSAGQNVLIHAAGSGVGTAATQIVEALAASALGTVRSASKAEACQKVGLPLPYVTADGTFAQWALAQTQGRGVDLILDLVGGAYVREDLSCIASRGAIMVVGLLAGPRVELDLGTLLRKRVSLKGTVLRSRGLEEKMLLAEVLGRRIGPLVTGKRVRPIVHCSLPLDDAAHAHELMSRNEVLGKVVLAVS